MQNDKQPCGSPLRVQQNSKLLLATTNPGKILEYKEIFKELNLKIELLSLKEAGISQKIEETGQTFEENARKKALFYLKLTGLPTLAEDSGLEIDYLNGEPGVKSRRWPGHKASDAELISMTLEKLRGVPLKKRGAQLRVIIALLIDKTVKTFEGILRGVIIKEPIEKIIPGYPFRSLFYVPEVDKVLGELTMEEEARIAHRKKALEKAIPILKSKFKMQKSK